MAAKLLTGYTTAITGVINFPAGHPGAGYAYLILTGRENGGFKWQDTAGGNSHAMMICIPWENIGTFRVYALMGAATVGGSLVRSLPMQSPFVAQFPNTYCSAVNGKGDGFDAGVTDSRLYADCILEVVFSTLNWQTEGTNAFLEFNVAGAADYDTIPDSSLAFSSGEKIDHDQGVLIASKDLQITAHNIPNPDSWETNLTPLLGKVNSTAVTIGAITYAAGYLQFPTYDLNRTLDSGGNLTAEGTIHLLWRSIKWNSGIRSDGAVDSITPAPYVTADLNGVLSA